MKGQNKLQVRYYLPHVLIFSAVYGFIINIEITNSPFYILLYFCVMVLYSFYLLLDLQMVHCRRYLLENNDYLLEAVFIDSDLFVPSNLIKYHKGNLDK